MPPATAPDPRWLSDRPWPQVGRPVVLLPLGSMEQHGPHLPLDTDTVIAEAVAGRLADELSDTGADVVVARAIAYGASGEHEGFAGTVSVGHEALEALLVEYGRSACRWAGRLVIVNGHGGNLPAIEAAVRLLRTEGRDVVWVPCIPDYGAVHDAHAGRTETSLLLHLAPGRVRLERATPGDTRPLAELMPELRRGGIAAVAGNGVLGDPRGATAEEGARLLGSMVEGALRRLEGTGDGPA